MCMWYFGSSENLKISDSCGNLMVSLTTNAGQYCS